MNDVENPVTTMVIGHDCRVIMGPCRQSTLLCIVGLVPDAKMHESSTSDSWTEKGSLEDLLESFKEFPEWIKEAFKGVDRDEIGLWQIRDLVSAAPACDPEKGIDLLSLSNRLSRNRSRHGFPVGLSSSAMLHMP